MVVLRLLSSLKLGISTILALVVGLAWATWIESRYDTGTAQYWVYHATWFHSLLLLLGLNIFCVAWSRYPWRFRHIPFLMAHAGILVLLLGAWFTEKFGIDGRLQLEEGETSALVDLAEAVLFIGFDNNYHFVPVPWRPPGVSFQKMDLQKFGLKGWSILSFLSHAERQVRFMSEESSAFPALKLRFISDQMHVVQDHWLWAGAPEWQMAQVGPAQVWMGQKSTFEHLGVMPQAPFLMVTQSQGRWIYSAESSTGVQSSGRLKVGEPMRPLGWKGGAQFIILESLPAAQIEMSYQKAAIQYGEEAPASAVQVQFPSSWNVTNRWLGLGEEISLQRPEKVRVSYLTRRFMLPFQLKLKKFVIDYQPGTRSPAGYRSYVEIIDPQMNSSAEFWIQMNEPLKWRGYTFYQVSYAEEGQVSLFAVNRDPGRWLKYGGSLLIVLGSCWLFLRKMQYRWMKVALLMLWISQVQAADLQPHTQWSFQNFNLIPIQQGGRIKPMDSFAREVLLEFQGNFQKWEGVDLLLSWTAFPDAWEQVPMLSVDSASQSLLQLSRQGLYSPRELFPLMTAPLARDLKTLSHRLELFHGIVSAQLWTLIPRSESWLSLIHAEKGDRTIEAAFANTLIAYQNGDALQFDRHSESLKIAVEDALGAQKAEIQKFMKLEFFYQHAHLFRWACGFYFLFFGLEIFNYIFQLRHRFQLGSFLVSSLGGLTHLLGMLLRCWIAGRPPVTNMYESVIWVSFGTWALSGVLYYFRRNRMVLWIATFLAGLALWIGDSVPEILDPGLHPLVPVLRSHYWLVVHVLIISLSYAAFTLAFGLANVSLFYSIKKDRKFLELNEMTYRAIQVGVVCIAAGTILGGIWADYAWGRFWGWDPKEVWALITLLCYIAVLHGRYAGWVDSFGFALLSVISFLSVLMAWYGVNFLLGVGLHSYGFSRGGWSGVASVIGFELFYLCIVIGLRKYRKTSIR